MTPAQQALQNQINNYNSLANLAKSCSRLNQASEILEKITPLALKLAEISSNVEYKEKVVIKEIPLKIEYITIEKEVIKEVPVEVIKEVEVVKYVERNLSEKAQEVLNIEMIVAGDFSIFVDSDIDNKIAVSSSVNSSLEKLKTLKSTQHYVQLGYIINSIMLLASFVLWMF